jgi:Cu(I)/Ag(I) efflux system membrane fusion protein
MGYGRAIRLLAGLAAVVVVAIVAATLSRTTGRGDGGASSTAASVWTCSMHPQVRRDGRGECPICGMQLIEVGQKGSAAAAAKEHDVWTCSMHPQVRKDAPGECPICGMDLIPAGTASAASEATGAVEALGVATAPVAYRELAREIRTVGKLDYNERRVADITARIGGRVDRLYADFTGIQVKEGDHLVDIYSPQLYQAQNELILALAAHEASRAAGQQLASRTVESARTRLRLWGITPEQLAEIERSREPRTHLTIFAPIGGTVIEKSVRVGQYVKEGDVMYRIADLDPLWLYLDLYEYDMGWVRYGQPVDVTLEAFPGERFRGTVTFINPFLDDATRTVKVRVNLPNPDRRLKPAMYASASIRVKLSATGAPEPTGIEGKFWCPMHPEVVSDKPGRCPICHMALERVPQRAPTPQPPAATGGGGAGRDHARGEAAAPPAGVLSVPVSAVLDTGRRTVAYRKAAGGGYELVEVEVGPRAEGSVGDGDGAPLGYYPVIRGLKEGDLVVVRGNFLLDSQRQIEGSPSLLYPEGQSAANLHAGHGEVGAAGPAAAPARDGGHQH